MIVNKKYMGEIITNTNNIEKQVQDKRRKAEAMINNIVNIAKDEVFRQMRINVMLEMYEKCLIQGVLCGAETWHYNKRQFKIIEDIQVNALLRILKLPKSRLYTTCSKQYLQKQEAGLWNIEYILNS